MPAGESVRGIFLKERGLESHNPNKAEASGEGRDMEEAAASTHPVP